MIKQKGIIVLILLVIVLLVAYVFYTRYGPNNVIENFNTPSILPTAQYVSVGFFDEQNTQLHLQEVQVYNNDNGNVALDKSVTSNPDNNYKEQIVNGSFKQDGDSQLWLTGNQTNKYVKIDLTDSTEISCVRVFLRPEKQHTMSGLKIRLLDSAGELVWAADRGLTADQMYKNRN